MFKRLTIIAITAALSACGGGGGGAPVAPVDPLNDNDPPTPPSNPSVPNQMASVDINLSTPFYHSDQLFNGLGLAISPDAQQGILTYQKSGPFGAIDVESFHYTASAGWSTDPQTIVPRPNDRQFEVAGLTMFGNGDALLLRADLSFSPATGWNRLGEKHLYNMIKKDNESAFRAQRSGDKNSVNQLVGRAAGPDGGGDLVVVNSDGSLVYSRSFGAANSDTFGAIKTDPLDNARTGDITDAKLLDDGRVIGLFEFKHVEPRAPRPGDAEQNFYTNYIVKRITDPGTQTWENAEIIDQGPGSFNSSDRFENQFDIDAAGNAVAAFEVPDEAWQLNFSNCERPQRRLIRFGKKDSGHGFFVASLDCEDWDNTRFYARKLHPVTGQWGDVSVVNINHAQRAECGNQWGEVLIDHSESGAVILVVKDSQNCSGGLASPRTKLWSVTL